MSEMDRIVAEIQKTHPPMTAAQHAARQRAIEALDEKYPGRLVAYIDTWSGDHLDRVVVADSADEQEFQDQLRALTPDARRRVELTQVPEPDVVECPSVWFLDEDGIEVV